MINHHLFASIRAYCDDEGRGFGDFRHADGTPLLQCFGVFLSCLVCVDGCVRVDYPSVAAQRGGLPSLGWLPAGRGGGLRTQECVCTTSL